MGMSRHHHYDNAPITEAIIEVRVDLPAASGLAQIERIYERISGGYPEKRARKFATGSFEIGEEVSASARSEQTGYLFESEDKKQIIQAQLTGFSLSRLAPYQSWEPFRNEMRWLWGVYREVARPIKVTRLGVRTVNRIDIPGANAELKSYFRTFPEISPELPQLMDGFFMQLRLPFPGLPGLATINQTAVPSLTPDVVSIVLDVDLFRGENIPQDEEEIWRTIDALHDCRNDIFEACITDAARRLFT
jgi:uncharacterized protein (TIGR04255 family)